jgi:transcriptional regulator with XRE-family HTH domain
MTFGERLKACRKSKGLTQLQLGKKLSLAESTISLYESGKRSPEKDILVAIANFFNVSLDDLLETDQKKSNSCDNTATEKLVNESQTSAEYLELHRLIRNMSTEETKKVLSFAKYTHMEANKRGPEDDDDF